MNLIRVQKYAQVRDKQHLLQHIDELNLMVDYKGFWDKKRFQLLRGSTCLCLLYLSVG